MDGAVAWHWWHVGHNVSVWRVLRREYGLVRLQIQWWKRTNMLKCSWYVHGSSLASETPATSATWNCLRQHTWRHIQPNNFHQDLDAFLEWSSWSIKAQLANFASISYLKGCHWEIEHSSLLRGSHFDLTTIQFMVLLWLFKIKNTKWNQNCNHSETIKQWHCTTGIFHKQYEHNNFWLFEIGNFSTKKHTEIIKS